MNLIRVSILEDNPEERADFSARLNAAPGLRCHQAYATAEQALAGVPGSPPDVLLADIRLGGRVNGIECVVALKQRLPELPILMLTAFEDTELLFRALQAGAVGYLLKRDPPERLFQSIEDAVHGGGAFNSVMARKVAQFFRNGELGPSAAPDRGPVGVLSPREHEILALLAKGRRYKEIVADLGIQLSTLRTHVGRIYDKLHVRSRTEAAMLFARSARDRTGR